MKIINKLLGREAQPELLLTPEMKAPERSVTDWLPSLQKPASGMVRQPDHPTSIAAAKTVEPQRVTLKAQVLQFAKDAGPGGFIDEELQGIDPSRPESSLRKRRTELAEKNWILSTGYNRQNSHGQDSTVWVHRDFLNNPPPLVSAPKKRKLSAALEERERIVAYLQREANDGASNVRDGTLAKAARAIRDGAHLQ